MHLEGWPLYENVCFQNAPFDLEISAVVFKIPNVFGKRSAICLFGIVKG